jgi:hypothetical protein
MKNRCESRPGRRPHWTILLLDLILLVPLLSCYSITYFINMNDDGSGAGTIGLTILLPPEAVGNHMPGPGDDPLQLAKNGWKNIRWSRDGKYVRMDADYPFDPAAGTGLPKDLGLKITVDEAENEYRYYTLSGTLDLSRYDKSWADTYESGKGVPDMELFGEKIKGISQEELKSMVDKYGQPRVILRVHLPGQTPVEAKGKWANSGDYMNGKTDTIEYVWTPDQNPIANLTVTRRLEPRRQISQEEMEANLAQLTHLYLGQIPPGLSANFLGLPTGGFINNSTLAHITDDRYTCGWYQNQVMTFLDGIRNNPDPNTRRLLDGYDYGPIQTAGGSHVAVVLYPAGTDWHESGTVLDPWPYQTPQAFPMSIWHANLTIYALYSGGPEPDANTGRNYPHLNGKPASYPATDVQAGQALPSRRVLVINSPVSVVVQLADGSRVGVMPDQTFVNDLVGKTYFYAVPNKEGGHAWLFYLPEEAFTVTVHGEDEGTVHAMLVTPQGASGYGPQPIQQQESGSFDVDAQGNLGTMAFDSGLTVQAFPITEDNLKESMGFEKASAAQPDQGPSQVPSSSESHELAVRLVRLMIYATGCFCFCGVPLLLGGAGLVFLLRRKPAKPHT